MRAGQRDHLISIEAKGVTYDAANTPVEGWSPYCRAWAGVFYGSGQEQRQAAQEQATQVAQFEVLSNAATRAIRPDIHRVSFNGFAWDITAVQELGLNAGVRLTAVARVD